MKCILQAKVALVSVQRLCRHVLAVCYLVQYGQDGATLALVVTQVCEAACARGQRRQSACGG